MKKMIQTFLLFLLKKTGMDVTPLEIFHYRDKLIDINNGERTVCINMELWYYPYQDDENKKKENYQSSILHNGLVVYQTETFYRLREELITLHTK